jgi:hypothetical protein
MTLKLTTPLRREIEIDGEPFTVVVSAEGIRLTRKRFRSGRALSWRGLWQGGTDEPDGRQRPDGVA